MTIPHPPTPALTSALTSDAGAHRAKPHRHGLWLSGLATACAVWLGVAAPAVSPVAPTPPTTAPTSAIVTTGPAPASPNGTTPVALVITP